MAIGPRLLLRDWTPSSNDPNFFHYRHVIHDDKMRDHSFRDWTWRYRTTFCPRLWRWCWVFWVCGQKIEDLFISAPAFCHCTSTSMFCLCRDPYLFRNACPLSFWSILVRAWFPFLDLWQSCPPSTWLPMSAQRINRSSDTTIRMACSQLNRKVDTFVVHLIGVRHIKTHVVMPEFRETQTHPPDILDLDNWGKDAQTVLLVFRIVEKVYWW